MTGFDEQVVEVRLDGTALQRDIARLRAELEGPLAQSAAIAGRAIDGALGRALANGRLGFDDLKRAALAALADIARAAISNGLGAIGGGGLLGGLVQSLAGVLGGAPGRATGGPVVGGRAYRVGERGPELFVPTSAGQIVAAPAGSGGQGALRPVAITINVGASGPGGDAGARLAASSRQIGWAVRRALAGLED